MVITGAGPIGLLAALIGVQRGLDVHVIDQVTAGLKPDLVRGLGASYHTGRDRATPVPDPDIVIECTGVARLVFDAMEHVGPGRGGLPHRRLVGRSTPSTSTPGCSTGRWCSRTRPWSARSTPTAATTRPAPTRWPRPTGAWLAPAGQPAGPARPLAGGARAPARRREGGDRGGPSESLGVDVMTRRPPAIAPGVDRDRHPARGLGAGDGRLPGRGDAPVLVETGSQSSVPVLLDALDALGVEPGRTGRGGGDPHPPRPRRGGGGRGAGLSRRHRVRAREGGAAPGRPDPAGRLGRPGVRAAARLALRPARPDAGRADPRAGRRRGDSGLGPTGCSPPWTRPGTPSTISPCTTR